MSFCGAGFIPRGTSPVPPRAPLPPSFWWLCTAGGLLAAGTADFALISFHYARQSRAGPAEIPMLYAAAMAIEGVAASALGFLLNRRGPATLMITILLSAMGAPLVFMTDVPPLAAVAVWSAGMGGQYALLRALVPGRVPDGSLGSAFGWFNTVFGIGWFAGSTAMGLLYAHSLRSLVWLAIGLQVASVPIVVRLHRSRGHRATASAA